MIGRVILADGALDVLDNGTLQTHALDTDLSKAVELLFDIYKKQHSISQGTFGVKFLYDIASMLGGEVAIKNEPETEHEEIY